jgi:protein-tyrosine phosphatase
VESKYREPTSGRELRRREEITRSLGTLAGVTDRLVPFEGVLNFRDLGGYQSDDGRRTRWRTVYRSDALHDLTEGDVRAFRELGVATVVDLRSASEIEYTGRGLLARETVHFVHAPLYSHFQSDEPRASFDEGYLARRYLEYLEGGAPAIVRVIEQMTNPASYPLVLNCFLGKDRTGVVTALVLSCLGVERSTVVEDYALTGARVPLIVEKFLRDPLLRDEVTHDNPLLLGAPAATMANFLADVDERYGGPVDWVLGAGVANESLERLRDLLLDED